MSRQIIKQPNGKYCIFSSIVDNVVYYDMSPDDIIKNMIEWETKRIKNQVNEIVTELENGGKPYYQFTKSYPEMIEFIGQIHGKKEMDKVKKVISMASTKLREARK